MGGKLKAVPRPQPNFLSRLPPKVRTGNRCLDCMIDTEINAGRQHANLSAGDELWYRNFSAEMSEYRRTLDLLRPRSVVDIGTGTGRVVRATLDVLPKAEITGTESNPGAFKYSAGRFRRNGRVTILNGDASAALGKDAHFDLAVSLMATLGNINDQELFNRIITHCDHFAFTVYNSDFDAEREPMYVSRGHVDFSREGRTYAFHEPGIEGLVSQSYSSRDINKMAREAGARIVELSEVEMLLFAVARKA